MVHAYVYYSCLGSLDYSLLSLYITDHTLHTTLYRGWVTTAINQLSCPFRLLLSIVNILMTYPDYDPQLILLPKLTNLKRNVAPVCFVYSSIFPPKVEGIFILSLRLFHLVVILPTIHNDLMEVRGGYYWLLEEP